MDEHLDKPWNWGDLSMNPGITIEDMLAHPDKPWKWGWLSLNPTITMKNVVAHADKPWNWLDLSMNKFTRSPKMRIVIIRKMQISLARHRCKMQLKILSSQSDLCIDLIKIIQTS